MTTSSTEKAIRMHLLCYDSIFPEDVILSAIKKFKIIASYFLTYRMHSVHKSLSTHSFIYLFHDIFIMRNLCKKAISCIVQYSYYVCTFPSKVRNASKQHK